MEKEWREAIESEDQVKILKLKCNIGVTVKDLQNFKLNMKSIIDNMKTYSKYLGVRKMEFEKKLNEMYQEIANKISDMIPVEWDEVYTKAYIKEESKEVFLLYSTWE